MKFPIEIAGCLFATLIISVPPALASGYTGNQLYADCSVNESDTFYGVKRSRCIAYIEGVVAGLNGGYYMSQFESGRNSTQIRQLFCIDSGVTVRQVVDVVTVYLRDRPAKRHEDADIIVFRAVQEAWPCSA